MLVRALIFTIGALAVGLAPQQSRAQVEPPPAEAVGDPLAIPLSPYGNGRMRQVQVEVAGDTLDFLFDTGGGWTVISPAVAARLGCSPGGRLHGHRMTGETLEVPVCRDVPLTVGGYRTSVEAAVMDLMDVLGPNAPPVHGMVSLHTFSGRALTLDLPHQRFTVETPVSLAERTLGMTPLRARLATGLEGGELTVYVGLPADGAEWWFLWDSGHQGTTFVAPWTARALGLADSARHREEVHLLLAPGQEALSPIEVKQIIHDGVLNAALIERAVWTVDLAGGRAWVSPIAPLLEAPPPSAQVAPPVVDPSGWYDVVLVVNGERQEAVMQLARAGDGLSGRLRFVTDEHVFVLQNVAAEGSRLKFDLPLRQTYPVLLTFEGLRGVGTWGDPASRGGAAEGTKRS